MLKIESLDIGYKEKINKAPIEANFELGNLIVLLGRNGAGKSTLLKTLGNFLPPLSGTLLIQNRAYADYNSKEFSKLLSIVTTERLNTPYMKVFDLIALGRFPYLGFWGDLREEDNKAIEEILSDLEIENLANKYISDCSDGEQQLVLIARALAQETPVLLLDEATAHLDFVNRIKIFHLLEKLAEKYQKLIFLATHELEIALKYAHQVILFQKNKIEIETATYFIENDILQEVFRVEGMDYKLNYKKG